jgi:hypothetical protein
VKDKLPVGVANLFWFNAFNALVYSICLGTPLILFARQLGASATTLGLLTGMPVVLGILQLPGARYVEDVGYKKSILAGWSARVFFLFFLSLLPFLVGRIPLEAVVNLLLATVFLFNLLVGISSGAWFPWMAKLIPDSIRGEYLAQARNYTYTAMVISVWSCALILGNRSILAFSLVFFICFSAGLISLHFLKKVPDVKTSRDQAKKYNAIPWLDIFKDKTFARFLAFGVFWAFVLSANATFVILFLRENVNFSDQKILALGGGSMMMGILSLNLMGKHTDKVGSKPYLGLVLVWVQISLSLWFVVASSDSHHFGWLLMTLMITGGLFGAMFDLSQTKLLMDTVGERHGSTQYYAVWAVCTSLTTAIMPVAWGIVLDAIGEWKVDLLGFTFNRFSILFGVEWLLLFPLAMLLVRVKDKKSESTTSVIYEVFVGYPTRTLSSVFGQFK